MSAREANFDGLVGPTHNYSGLSFGNLASKNNRGGVASPKLAALQGDFDRTLVEKAFIESVLLDMDSALRYSKKAIPGGARARSVGPALAPAPAAHRRTGAQGALRGGSN